MCTEGGKQPRETAESPVRCTVPDRLKAMGCHSRLWDGTTFLSKAPALLFRPTSSADLSCRCLKRPEESSILLLQSLQAVQVPKLELTGMDAVFVAL